MTVCFDGDHVPGLLERCEIRADLPAESGALTMTGLSRWRLDEKPEYERVLGSNSCDLTPVLTIKRGLTLERDGR